MRIHSAHTVVRLVTLLNSREFINQREMSMNMWLKKFIIGTPLEGVTIHLPG